MDGCHARWQVMEARPIPHSPLSSPTKAGDPVFQRRRWDTEKLRRTGYPAFAGYDTAAWTLISLPFPPPSCINTPNPPSAESSP
ncbi:hypothetical protein ACVIW2_007063 [Bradyrhizobium huanghuaihaiense]